jgi:hypothetical protein
MIFLLLVELSALVEFEVTVWQGCLFIQIVVTQGLLLIHIVEVELDSTLAAAFASWLIVDIELTVKKQ